MKKIIGFLLISAFLFSLYLPVLATETTQTKDELIQQLQQEIEELKTQIAELTSQLEALKETKQEIKTTLKLLRELREGMTSDDVKLLQEILATDPEIYPEGRVTGYFGPLTKNAVKRFQKLAGFEQVGQVGPKTLAKINELLTEGAGQSGKVPPGLLIAPGIRKKISETSNSQTSTAEQACLAADGTVETTNCCLSANDFPNLCLIGACGCAAGDSHEVKTCNCGSNKCFNGTSCVSQ